MKWSLAYSLIHLVARGKCSVTETIQLNTLSRENSKKGLTTKQSQVILHLSNLGYNFLEHQILTLRIVSKRDEDFHDRIGGK